MSAPEESDDPVIEAQPDAPATPAIAEAGDPVDEITVQIGPQFLELFSEHLYSSPNKAFEELVSNSWDAGATSIYIGMSADLTTPDAAVWVLDNGVSMDRDGLEALWAVATSTKRTAAQSSRPQIGKFGIGKLATYLLANCLTYICKASDGVVRAVTMDYRRIDEQEASKLHIDPLPLAVRELNDAQLAALLDMFPEGTRIKILLDEHIPPAPVDPQYDNEFRGPDAEVEVQDGTWTLAVLTSLKGAGQAMQAGHIKRMLRYALPLGASLRMDFNGTALESTKVKAEVETEWVLGRDLGITEITVGQDEDNEEEPAALTVQEVNDAGAGEFVTIEGIPGQITGTVRLYEQGISGGKSEAIGSSNGFIINVLGRVINENDPYFGLENLNHSAWAKFRATIRADGLDGQLAVNREGLLDSSAVVAFRKFLFAIFNKARAAHDARNRANWPNVGQVLTDTWGTIPLQALREVITDCLASGSDLPPFVVAKGVDREAALAEFDEADPENVADFISDVVLEDLLASDPFVSYDLATHRVVVNRQHPFAQEHGETHEQQLLLRDTALVDLLTQAYMAGLGVDMAVLEQVGEYRDQSLRLVAQRRRRTGVQLGQLLVDATQYATGLERVVGDSLEFLGFEVRRLGAPGQPEGVATAPAEPADPELAASYSFTYDAKSSGSGKVKTGNVGVSGLVRHRADEGTDYTLVVAPDYEVGALERECAAHKVTPMRAADLAKLLLVVATHGIVDLSRYQGLFELYAPDDVETWVEEFVAEATARRRLGYDVLLEAIERVGLAGPDAITVAVLAREARQILSDSNFPTRREVSTVLRGLEVLLPQLVRVSSENVYFGTPPAKLREAIRNQLSAVPANYRFNVEAPSETPDEQGGAG
jgi:hypothetical protein